VTALAIDLETIPLLSAMQRPYPEAERTPPANYRDPAKIYEWRQADLAAWETERIKQYSLSPLFGRIVAVGMACDPPGDNADEIVTHSLLARQESDEKELLTRLVGRIDREADPLVTWNGMGFDVPFLLTRCAILGVPTPRVNLLKRYSTATHYDVKMVTSGWDSFKARQTTLADWAQAFGLGGKVAHGSQVYDMYKSGQLAEIGAYAADDARLTLALYHRVSVAFYG
jgi:predicted PolB exonuclease-like 3'-5' exonuclease